MCDESKKFLVAYEGLTRRRFTALAAVAGAMGGPAFAQAAVTERDVAIPTQDGSCDAVLFHPGGAGAWPGVLLWPDAGGLRPVKRDMGRRLAAQGYAVLVVNPYYRGGTAASLVNSTDPAVQQGIAARRTAARTAMTDEAVDRDAT